MSATELIRTGRLSEATAAAVDQVKAKPTDPVSRLQLAELLCFSADWDRADKHLNAIGQQDPKALMNIALFRQLIRGEKARQQFFSEGRLPEFLDHVPERLQLHLKASIEIREGNDHQAAKLLEQAESERISCSGVCADQPFSEFRDLDDLTASFLEVITSSGKYYWVPFEKIRKLEFREPQRTRDLIWRSVSIEVAGGPDGEVYIPVIYPTRPDDIEQDLILGRRTDWIGGGESPVRGVGQRTMLIGDEGRGILELTAINFESDQDNAV